jgi:DNA-binding MarR family transcriptional regulator
MIGHSDIAACKDCLCDATRRAARTVTAVYDHALARHGIRISQFTILANLELRGATSLGGLAKVLELDRTTLTRNLALLEEKDWVESRPATKDSRSRILSLTKEGRATLFAAFPAWREAQDRVARAVRGTDLALLSALTKIPHLQ